jgi:hypothetical protein
MVSTVNNGMIYEIYAIFNPDKEDDRAMIDNIINSIEFE